MTSICFRDGFDLDLDNDEALTAPVLRRLADETRESLDTLRAAVEAKRIVDDLEEKLEQARRWLDETVGDAALDQLPAGENKPASIPADPESKPDGADRVACPQCGKEVAPRGINAHVRNAHSAPVRCDGCEREFRSPSGLARHRKSCTGPAASAPVTKPDAPAAEPLAGGVVAAPDLVVEPDPVEALWDAVKAVSRPTPATSTAPTTMPTSAPHPMVALCSCGHTQRRHDGQDGYCLVGDCECSAYAGTAA